MARWAAVTLGQKVDRGSAVLGVARALRAFGAEVAGFVQRQEAGSDAVELVRLWVPGRARLGARSVRRAGDEGCAFAFEAGAFATARGWLEADAPTADVLLVHEIGKRELEGGGHAPALNWALARPGQQIVVFCARAERLGPILDRFPLPGDPVAWLEHHAAGTDPARFGAELAAAAGLEPCGHE